MSSSLAWGIGVSAVLVLSGLMLAWLCWCRTSLIRRSIGMNYFGLPAEERKRWKASAKLRGALLWPMAWLVAGAVSRERRLQIWRYQGVACPSTVSTEATIQRALALATDDRDILIAGHMRSGTTWLTHLVFQILTQGEGDVAASGHSYRLFPWLEADFGIAPAEAPLLGEPARRVLKTHLPVVLCPYGEKAKYLYVTRHPLDCYASTLDFLGLQAGPFLPSRDILLDWFLSRDMYWTPWPDHVAGWWRWSQEKTNVLFLHFEDMLSDVAGSVRHVAGFLGFEVGEAAIGKIADNVSWPSMKAQEELFEMTPPTLFSHTGSFFPKGPERARTRLDPDERARILAFCRDRLKDTGYPLDRYFS